MLAPEWGRCLRQKAEMSSPGRGDGFGRKRRWLRQIGEAFSSDAGDCSGASGNVSSAEAGRRLRQMRDAWVDMGDIRMPYRPVLSRESR